MRYRKNASVWNQPQSLYVDDGIPRPVAVGDLTSRILAALIEENIIAQQQENNNNNNNNYQNNNNPNNNNNSNNTNNTNNNNENIIIPIDTNVEPDSDRGVGILLKDATDTLPPNNSHTPTLPLNAPPTYDYSHLSVLSLEERIKMELKSVGLLDDFDDLDVSIIHCWDYYYYCWDNY